MYSLFLWDSHKQRWFYVSSHRPSPYWSEYYQWMSQGYSRIRIRWTAL